MFRHSYVPLPAILAMDHHGEPVDQHGEPLDPENILDEDRIKLDGLIVDNVRITNAVPHA